MIQGTQQRCTSFLAATLIWRLFSESDRREMGERQNDEVPDSEEPQEDQVNPETSLDPVIYNTAWRLKFFAGALFGLLLLVAMYFGFKWLV